MARPARHALSWGAAFIRRFAAAREAAVAPILGIVCLMLIGCMGIAIDTGRAMVVKARLVSALDAAGLAVGARVATSDFTSDAKKFVAANFKANYAGATVTSVTATPNSDKTLITLAATATMPTAFMKLFGVNQVTVNAATEVTRASAGLEVVMVLDNTGSMEDSGSMPTLKSSANSLVNILFGDNASVDNLYVGLVPFSQTVNIGAARTPWVVATSIQSATNPYYPAQWLGCVEARTGGLDQTDDPPTATKLFKAYYSPNSSYNNWLFLGLFLNIDYSNYKAMRGPSAYCPSAMTFLTNQKSTITSGIAAMKPGGSTMINFGAIWGWRMLSPRWRGVWGTDATSSKLPLDYGTKNMSKAVVLMTDGENSFASNNYTAYGYLSDARLGTSLQTNAEGELDKRLTAACTSMKSAGIVVYTVAFNNPDASVKSLLQGCATNLNFYFDAADNASLTAAFQTIGSSLSKLRISK